MPTSLHELVHNVVESMSSNLLNHSTVAGDFPKEAVFQHLFLDGLARFTKADCSICPELSKIFRDPNSGGSDSVPGEIDFYLNGNLCWGIELLVNGIGTGEHLSRFSTTGKYFPLGVADYVVVDLCRNKSGGQPPNIARHPKRITVFFKDDKFESAQCLFGSAETINFTYIHQCMSSSAVWLMNESMLKRFSIASKKLCVGLPNVDPAKIAIKVLAGLYSGVTTVQLDQLAAEDAIALQSIRAQILA
ncbi:hypothetical protein HDU80_011724 [Chytriomyces hyalinus]|nr:hypothetical protein HDU80_011724 [Chytriomyces hyalinus]